MSAAIRPPFPFRRPSLLTIIKRDSRATPTDTTPGSKRMCFSQTDYRSPNIGGMNEPHPQHPTQHKPDLYNTAIALRRPFMKRKSGPPPEKTERPSAALHPGTEAGAETSNADVDRRASPEHVEPGAESSLRCYRNTAFRRSFRALRRATQQQISRRNTVPAGASMQPLRGRQQLSQNKIQVASLFRPRAEQAKTLRRLPKTRADTLRRCPLAVRIAITGD